MITLFSLSDLSPWARSLAPLGMTALWFITVSRYVATSRFRFGVLALTWLVTSTPSVADPTAARPERTNRLAHEKSPYLLQHAHNPVDWYPWGEEAFAKARRENKPIFLSVGYSTCHWCHVMAHESFEDAETAQLMNELYVCVKVDREERPDIDNGQPPPCFEPTSCM